MLVKQQMDFLARWKAEQDRASGRSAYLAPRFIALYVFLAIAIIVMTASPWAYAYILNKDLTDLNSRLAEFGPVQQKLLTYENISKQVKEANQVLTAYNQSKLNLNDIINKLLPHLPQGTTISSLSIKEDKTFQISFNIPTPVDMLRLWVKLRDSGLFQTIDINTVPLQEKPQTLSLTLKFAESK